jgi:hypothetical protein
MRMWIRSDACRAKPRRVEEVLRLPQALLFVYARSSRTAIAGAAMRIALHATIPRMRRSSLAKMQHETLTLARDAVQELMSKVDEEMSGSDQPC